MHDSSFYCDRSWVHSFIFKQESAVTKLISNNGGFESENIVKLDRFGDRFLSAEDEEFIRNVDRDIVYYIEHRAKNR